MKVTVPRAGPPAGKYPPETVAVSLIFSPRTFVAVAEVAMVGDFLETTTSSAVTPHDGLWTALAVLFGLSPLKTAFQLYLPGAVAMYCGFGVVATPEALIEPLTGPNATVEQLSGP